MGCWNETCFFSNLPIMAGERIVLIPLISSFGIESGKTCYVTDNYSPMGFVFRGEYNDYGGIENYSVSNIINDFFSTKKIKKIYNKDVTEEDCIKAFKQSSLKSPMNIAKNLMQAEPIDFANIDEFLEHLIHEGLCYGIRKLPLNFVMIHEELYDSLINEIGERIPYGQGKTFRKLWEENIYNFKAKKEQDKKIWKELGMDIVPCISSPSQEIGIPGANGCYDFMLSKILEGRDDLIDVLVDTVMLTTAVSLSRKGYLCLSGAGSQSQEYKIHLLLSNFIEKKAKEHENTEESLFWWERSY